MRYHVAGQSHRGAVRESNQDVVDWRINDAGDQALLVVADGMPWVSGCSCGCKLLLTLRLRLVDCHACGPGKRLQKPVKLN